MNQVAATFETVAVVPLAAVSSATGSRAMAANVAVFSMARVSGCRCPMTAFWVVS